MPKGCSVKKQKRKRERKEKEEKGEKNKKSQKSSYELKGKKRKKKVSSDDGEKQVSIFRYLVPKEFATPTPPATPLLTRKESLERKRINSAQSDKEIMCPLTPLSPLPPNLGPEVDRAEEKESLEEEEIKSGGEDEREQEQNETKETENEQQETQAELSEEKQEKQEEKEETQETQETKQVEEKEEKEEKEEHTDEQKEENKEESKGPEEKEEKEKETEEENPYGGSRFLSSLQTFEECRMKEKRRKNAKTVRKRNSKRSGGKGSRTKTKTKTKKRKKKTRNKTEDYKIKHKESEQQRRRKIKAKFCTLSQILEVEGSMAKILHESIRLHSMNFVIHDADIPLETRKKVAQAFSEAFPDKKLEFFFPESPSSISSPSPPLTLSPNSVASLSSETKQVCPVSPLSHSSPIVQEIHETGHASPCGSPCSPNVVAISRGYENKNLESLEGSSYSAASSSLRFPSSSSLSVNSPLEAKKQSEATRSEAEREELDVDDSSEIVSEVIGLFVQDDETPNLSQKDERNIRDPKI